MASEVVDPDHYASVFYPGGHAPMEDLAVDADSGPLLDRVPAPRHPARRGLSRPGRALAAIDAEGPNAFAGTG